MALQEESNEELRFLLQIEIKEEKAKELLVNKRVRKVLATVAERIAKPADLKKDKKKLVHKVIEIAHTPEAAGTYIDLIVSSVIKTETDIKNAESILKSTEGATEEEVKKRMEGNIPTLEEIDTIATEVIEENMGEPKAKIIRELKHHPRLQFIDPKKILETMAKLEIRAKKEEPPGMEVEEGKGLTEKGIESLLEMALLPNPSTRAINRMYQKMVIPPYLHASKERKWMRYLEREMQTMHTPFTNYQKTPKILRDHIERTKGQVRVRFLPEPNGHLHIGHAKAMSINFGYRDFYNGWISLRYDDTNPKAEKTEFYEKIEEMVRWMGFKPDAITHASDYFDRLYECAVELIKRGKAYVCHLSREEVTEKRRETMATRHTMSDESKEVSPWRDRGVEENLKEFQRMKDGEYEEGKAVLRMKMDMASDNPQLWDLVAYRVIKHPHVRTGTRWVIYPSYDFTHCLTDSFEDITHSFCTTEFINSRESYNWLCDALDLYRPVQWEYSRLNITGALLSKRFITKSIEDKVFTGWDDPRLSTLEGLRSRGVPASSIRRFVESLGITTAASEISQVVLDNIIREDLSESSKAVAVLTPIEIQAPGCTVLVDRKDFREEEPTPDFYRIQEGTIVFLKEIGKVKLVDKKSRKLEKSNEAHQAVIPWLDKSSPKAVLEIVHKGEIVEYRGARVSHEAAKSPLGMYWQFIRIGFFIRVEDKEGIRFRMVAPLKSSPLLD